MSAWEILLVAVSVIALVAVIGRVVQALVQVAATVEAVPWFRPAWFVFIVIAPIVGTIAWFAFGEASKPWVRRLELQRIR
jgi:hypothetical protein